MQPEDVPLVMVIERECFAMPWRESAYLTEIANRSAYYIVACVDSEIVGYGGVGSFVFDLIIAVVLYYLVVISRWPGDAPLVATGPTGGYGNPPGGYGSPPPPPPSA